MCSNQYTVPQICLFSIVVINAIVSITVVILSYHDVSLYHHMWCWSWCSH